MIKLLITGGKSSGKTVAACCAYRQLSKAKFEDNNMGDFGKGKGDSGKEPDDKDKLGEFGKTLAAQNTSNRRDFDYFKH